MPCTWKTDTFGYIFLRFWVLDAQTQNLKNSK